MQQRDRRQQLEARVAEAKAEAEHAPNSPFPYLKLAQAYEELASLDADFAKRAPLPDSAYEGRSYPELPPEGPPLLHRTRHWLRCRLDVCKKLVALDLDSELYRTKLFETLDLLDDIEFPLSQFARDEIEAVIAVLHHPEGLDSRPIAHPLSGLADDEIEAGLSALAGFVDTTARPIAPPTRHAIWFHLFMLRKPKGHPQQGWSAAIVLAGLDHPAIDLRLARWAAAVTPLNDAAMPRVAALKASLRLHGGARISELLRLDVRALAWVTQRAERFSMLWQALIARHAEAPSAIDFALLAELSATQALSNRQRLLEPLEVRSWLDRASICKALGAPPPPCAQTDQPVPRWLPAVSAAELRDPLTGAFLPSVLTNDPRLWPYGESRTTLDPRLPIEIVMIDIDCFKNTNNQFGHLVGDDVLRRLVDYLHTEVGDRVVRRIDEDEFLILWETGNGPALAAHLVETIRTTKWTSRWIETPFTHVAITVSASAASGASLAEAQKRAGAALREMKQSGR